MLKTNSLRTLITSLVAACLVGIAPQTMAADDDTWYQIEVIVAQRITTDAPLLDSAAEQFAFAASSKKWHHGRTLTPFDAELDNLSDLDYLPFIDLPSNQHFLKAEARKLAHLSEYQVMAHHSWRQVLHANKVINWVDVKGGFAWGGYHQLEGSLGFSKGRYLHIHSDIHLNQFPSVASNLLEQDQLGQQLLSAGQTLAPAIEKRFSLVQRRKMRSNELHYLDHPRLVLLVKVIPYTPAEPIIETSTLPDES